MKNQFRDNIQKLKALLDQTNATDKAGSAITLENALDRVLKAIIQGAKRGKKLIFIGNGGSAAIASHMATDFWKNAGVRAVAFNDSVLLTCVSNDNGYQHVFEKPLEMFADDKDILMAISSSGQSENILRAVSMAKAKGLTVFTFSGFKPTNALRGLGEINFYVPISQYGYVEIIHHHLCHSLVDVIISNKLIS